MTTKTRWSPKISGRFAFWRVSYCEEICSHVVSHKPPR